MIVVKLSKMVLWCAKCKGFTVHQLDHKNIYRCTIKHPAIVRKVTG